MISLIELKLIVLIIALLAVIVIMSLQIASIWLGVDYFKKIRESMF